MERSIKFWGLALGTLAVALGLGTFVSQSVAAREVSPVADRVTKLEVRRDEDVKKLDEVRNDVKELLRRVPVR